MRWSTLRTRLRATLRGRSIEHEQDEEIQFHLEQEAAKLIRGGVAADEARRRARAAFGGVEVTREALRDGRGDRWIRDCAGDLRYSWRTLWRNPTFAATGILTLTLGIGACVAIFSAVNAVLLRPLPFAQPDRLAMLWESNPDKGWTRAEVAPANFLDWKETVTSFAGVAGWSSFQDRQTLVGHGDPVALRTVIVTGNFFSVLGSKPLLGRVFEDRETWNTGVPITILSYRLWRDRFSSDRSVIGSTIDVNGERVQVVGVMGEDMTFPSATTDMWRPIGWEPSYRDGVYFRRAHWMNAVARLRDGVSMTTAAAELHRVMSELERRYPATNTHMQAGMEPMQDALTSDVRKPLFTLLAATGLLLLIACANVGNLLLVRSAARERELVLRRALGAGVSRVIRQALAESLLLAALGGAAGYALGWWGARSLLAMQPPGLLPVSNVHPDGRVAAALLVVTSLCAVVFGIVPAFWSGRRDPADVLKEGSRTGSDSKRMRSWGNALVVGEIALALMLTVGAGLLVRSLWNITRVSPGFDAHNVLTVQLSLPSAKYGSDEAGQTEKIRAFYDELLLRARGVPGVSTAALASDLPLTGPSWSSDFSVAGRPPEAYGREVVHRQLSPGYFHLMRVPLLAGRDFTDRDVRGSEPVIILNQSLVRKYFGSENPIGQRIAFDKEPDSTSVWNTVIGVVGDEHQGRLSEDPRIEIFAPSRQDVRSGAFLLLRTNGDPLQLVSTVRRLIADMDPALAIMGVRTMEDVQYHSMARERFMTALVLSFAVVGVLLAIVGVYGVMSQLAQRRIREMGIRMALGARASAVRWLMVRHGLLLIGGGAVIGSLLALASTGPLDSMLFGVGPRDGPTYAAVLLVLVTTGLIACAVPARRAAQASPAETLRAE
ncbi:MAG: ABC transporter permease [Gemmatimonadaceae bacterium]